MGVIIVRERRDLVAERQAKDKLLTAARSELPARRNPKAVNALFDRLANIDARIREIDKTLKSDFPDYAALTRPEPLSVVDVQALLDGDEALLLILDTLIPKPTPEECFIWVVTKGDIRWVKSEIGTKALTERVVALCCRLDDTLLNNVEGAKRCNDVLGAEPRTETAILNGKEE